MNSKTAKLINRFSKIGLVDDSRQIATTNNPKKVIKQKYKNIIYPQRHNYKQYMMIQIIKFRSNNVE